MKLLVPIRDLYNTVVMREAQTVDTYETITIKPLHSSFAAEVQGVNFADLSTQQFDEVLAALAKVSALDSS